MKVGDELYCYKSISSFKCGSLYIITEINSTHFNLIDNLWFTLLPDIDGESYKDWFISQSEYRKLKIKQLSLLNI